MRVLIISQYFWPENFRVNELSEELNKLGHKVTILTGYPNYPSGVRTAFPHGHGLGAARGVPPAPPGLTRDRV